jgi:hypothetical protein
MEDTSPESQQAHSCQLMAFLDFAQDSYTLVGDQLGHAMSHLMAMR